MLQIEQPHSYPCIKRVLADKPTDNRTLKTMRRTEVSEPSSSRTCIAGALRPPSPALENSHLMLLQNQEVGCLRLLSLVLIAQTAENLVNYITSVRVAPLLFTAHIIHLGSLSVAKLLVSPTLTRPTPRTAAREAIALQRPA